MNEARNSGTRTLVSFTRSCQTNNDVWGLRRKLLGERHFEVALGFVNLGDTLNEQGSFAEAERMIREGLAIFRSTLPDRHIQIALTLNDLADTMKNRNRYEDAERLYREALAIFENASADPADAAPSWEGLGDVF